MGGEGKDQSPGGRKIEERGEGRRETRQSGEGQCRGRGAGGIQLLGGQAVLPSHLGRRKLAADVPLPLAGVEAIDDADGNITHRISAQHLTGRIDTAHPTADEAPNTVVYSAKDLSGNAAAMIAIQLHVLCPPGTLRCPPPEDGGPLVCSPTPSLCPFHYAAASTSVSPSGGGDAPSMRLIGPEEVRIPVGSPYEQCGPLTPAAVTCERGATAYDAIDGDLTSKIEARGPAVLFCLVLSPRERGKAAGEKG